MVLYASHGSESTHLLEFGRMNLPLMARRVTVMGADERAVRATLQGLELPSTIEVATHLLPAPESGALARAVDEKDGDLVLMAPEIHWHWLSRRPDWAFLEDLPVPVLWARGRARRIARILLASGGDEHTLVDVQVTARLAAPAEAKVTLLHVLSQVPVAYHGLHGDEEALEPLQGDDSEVGHVLRYACRLLDERGIATDVQFREGLVVETVLATLEEGNYDLLVLGAHSSSGVLDSLLLENVTRDLAGRAQIPVLVARVRTHLM